MKIDRLIGILSVLLQQDKVTAPELAERFEVSRRTINRDIEDLCKAGIPIATTQGTGGGIQIMEGYRPERTLLTSKDMQMILAGLRSLDSVSGSQYYSQLMEKLQCGSSNYVRGQNSILIDLASWYREALVPKIELLQDAIEQKYYVSFQYFSSHGEGVRKIEPYYLLFKWSSWYVWGWCCKREAFRLFKLNRMEQLQIVQDHFEGREVPEMELSNEKIFPRNISVKVLFDPSVKWRLIEEFGPHCFTEQQDHKLLYEMDYTDKDHLISWLLTFGDKAELIEPEEIREDLLRVAYDLIHKYDHKE